MDRFCGQGFRWPVVTTIQLQPRRIAPCFNPLANKRYQLCWAGFPSHYHFAIDDNDKFHPMNGLSDPISVLDVLKERPGSVHPTSDLLQLYWSKCLTHNSSWIRTYVYTTNFHTDRYIMAFADVLMIVTKYRPMPPSYVDVRSYGVIVRCD